MELVMPDGGVASEALGLLRRAYAQRLLRSLHASSGRSVIVRALVSLSQSEPDAARAIVLEPTIAVLLETGSLRDALAAIALELALRGRLGSERRELTSVRRLFSVESNLCIDAERSITIADGLVAIDGSDHGLPSLVADSSEVGSDTSRVSRPFPTLVGRIRFAGVDPNPLAHDETHPEKDGNALSLGGRSDADWLVALRRAFELIETYLPAVASEMREMLRLVIPVGASDERHLSASYREYVGAVYLSLHRDPVTMAEALIHEFQHNKLNLVSWHYPILENGYDFLYKSPVRPDPRPLMGILLAAHAFVPVAEFHRRVLDAAPEGIDLLGVEKRLTDVVARNEEALAVVSAHGKPASAGQLVLDRLTAIHAAHRARFTALVPNVSHVA